MYEPLLSFLLCVLPFAFFPGGDRGPDDCDDPFAKFREGECDGLDVSLSRRIVSSCRRLRFEMWRDNLPRLGRTGSSSVSLSLSEKLRLRFPAEVCSEGLMVLAGGWSERLAVGSGVSEWA